MFTVATLEVNQSLIYGTQPKYHCSSITTHTSMTYTNVFSLQTQGYFHRNSRTTHYLERETNSLVIVLIIICCF